MLISLLTLIYRKKTTRTLEKHFTELMLEWIHLVVAMLR